MPQSRNNIRGLRRVLIVRFSAIGEVAMTVPAVYSVCRCYPEMEFVMVTRQSMTSIFVNPPSNLTVIGVDLKARYKGLTGAWRLAVDLVRAQHPDGMVDLQDNSYTRVMRGVGRLRALRISRIHKGLGGKRALTRKRDKVMLPLVSSRKRYRDAFRRLGLMLTDNFDGLFPEGSAPAAAYSAIEGPRPEGVHWVGIAPFAKHPGKIYPLNQMEEVVSQLSSYPDIRIFLFGGGDSERTTLNKWAQRYPGVRSLAGERHGFGVELALLSNLDCMLSMDSANMHLASLASIPVVSVWGATHPYCGFKGWHQKDDYMIQLPLTCRPCSVFGDKPCYRGDHLCLSAIKPQVIVDKILSIIGEDRIIRQTIDKP